MNTFDDTASKHHEPVLHVMVVAVLGSVGCGQVCTAARTLTLALHQLSLR